MRWPSAGLALWTRRSFYAAPLDQVNDSSAPWKQIASTEDKVWIAGDSVALHGSTVYLLRRKECSQP